MMVVDFLSRWEDFGSILVGRLLYESSVFVRVRGKIGYFGMQIVIVVLNKYLEIISLSERPRNLTRLNGKDFWIL